MSHAGILILGSTGMLGRELAAECARRDAGARGLAGPEQLDVTDAAAVERTLRRETPAVVINATGYTDVDGAETDRETAERVNAAGPRHVARACRDIDALLVHYSTDYVFDGRAGRPYTVEDEPNPISVYGRTKLAGEAAVLESGCRHLLIRTSWLFATHGRNFVRTILDLSGRRPKLDIVDDQHGRPTYGPDLARMTLDLLDRGARGVHHAANAGHCSWFDLATAVVARAGVACEIRPCPTSGYPLPAPRPPFSVLDLGGTVALIGPPRPWQDAVNECVGRLIEQRATPVP